jgi:DNA-binding CsgD family transcriptional regulator
MVTGSEGGAQMSQKEVAKTLGLNVRTVKTIERQALHKLRKHTRQLREIQGLLMLRRDGLWLRPYWILSAQSGAGR